MNAGNISLTGKVAIVTGAGSGIGAVIARSLAAAGARVAGLDINEQGAIKVAEEIRAASKDARMVPVKCDVSSLADCNSAFQQIKKALGSVDILVNNAGLGVTYPRPNGHVGPMRFWEADPERWLRTIAVNNNGPYLLARLVAPDMMKKGWGRIINVSTGFVTMLAAGRSAYGPAKAGLEASSSIWAKELAGTGVTVNVILPGGATDTAIKGGMETGLAEPGRTLLSPDIFTAPIRWLASEKSDGVSGYRFIAKDWDNALEPAQAALKCRSPVAWAKNVA